MARQLKALAETALSVLKTWPTLDLDIWGQEEKACQTWGLCEPRPGQRNDW